MRERFEIKGKWTREEDKRKSDERNGKGVASVLVS